MRTGIISAGNWIVDVIKSIDAYPSRGNLTTIRESREALGGCAHNVLVDLARLKSGIPLYAGGCVGDDRYGQMCLDAIRKYGIDDTYVKILSGQGTAYTDVMSERGTSSSRTFFHHRGANAMLGAEEIMQMDTTARIFHLGYLLLLDSIDKEDTEYGVVGARCLDFLSRKGYKTSIDVVSEEGDRFGKIVLPCLKYTDYLIINEVEAGKCLDREIRRKDGSIDFKDVECAASELLSLGVREIVAIHFPEGSVAAGCDGATASFRAFRIDPGKIAGTVGAGDAFCAGALYAIHEGYGLKDVLSFATASAYHNLFSSDSTSGAPSLKEIQDFLLTHTR